MRAIRRPLALVATCTTAIVGVGWVAGAPPAAAATGNTAAVADCSASAGAEHGVLDATSLHACLNDLIWTILPGDKPSDEPESSDATEKGDLGLLAPFGAVGQEPAREQAAPSAGQSSALTALRQCESGGNYATNTGNGYYGAYQFALSTWQSLGYSGYPHQASPATQDQAAVELRSLYGWGQWPACSSALGLR